MRLAAALAGLAFAGAACAAAPLPKGAIEEGAVLRDEPLYGIFHDYRRLSELRGKPLVINVWASWCAPCRAEMASLDRLARRHNGQSIHVIGISTDDYPEKAADFLTRTQVSFDNYVDRKLLWETMLGANRIPLTVFVDAKGRLVKRVYGAREWDSPDNLALVESLLGVKLAAPAAKPKR